MRSDADDPGATLGAQRSADPLHPLHGGSPSPPLTERIESIDALRGFALVGILFINITSMGGPIESERPAAPPSLGDPDWLVWLFGHLFVYGSMRGIFSMLFGASALLFLREPSRSRGLFLRRCFWLFGFGMLNATVLLWPGDILMIYAVAAPVVLLFLDAPPRRLIVVALALLSVLSVGMYVVLASAPADATAGAVEAAGLADALAREQSARLGGYLDNLRFMSATSVDWTLSPFTLYWIIDAAAFMLIGMALFRAGILSGSASTAVHRRLAVLGMGVGLPLRVWEALLIWQAGGDPPALTMAVHQAGRLAMTLGWIGVFMLLWQRSPWRVLSAPLGALGRMAFTGYLAQSVIAALIFSGFGLGLWNRLSWAQMWALVPVIMLPMSLACLVWLGKFRMGPLEWVWRRLTFRDR
ncbi:MAG: DUF418 domain-containing protein [Gammaproteobacteria bacterium]